MCQYNIAVGKLPDMSAINSQIRSRRIYCRSHRRNYFRCRRYSHNRRSCCWRRRNRNRNYFRRHSSRE
jgi:hypothetical protein